MIQIPLKLEDLSGRFLGRLERFTGFVSLKPIYTIYNIYEKKSIQEFGSSQNFSREKNLLFECIEHNLDVSTFFVLPICFSKGVASNHPASIHGDDDFSQTTQVPTQSHPPPPPKRWWQLKYFWSFHPETWGRWTHFDLRIFFNWVGEKPPTSYILVTWSITVDVSTGLKPPTRILLCHWALIHLEFHSSFQGTARRLGGATQWKGGGTSGFRLKVEECGVFKGRNE